MARIDIGKTAFAGFDLVARRPLTIVGWAVFILVLGILPVAGVMAAMGPAFADLVALGKAGGEPTPDQMMPLITTWYTANPILWVLSLLVRVMLAGAVFRAVLEPKNSGWAYLRLGMGEVMLGLVVICMSILLGVGAMIWVAVSAGVGIALWQASHAATIGFGIVSGVALVVAMIWLSLRFSLAAPMSFAERNFRLFESWTVTRGNAFNLLLVAIIIVLIVMVLEAVIGALAFAGVFAATGMVGPHNLDPHGIEEVFRQPPDVLLRQLGPWLLAGGVVASLIGAAATAIVTAPWAEAYRQLRGAPGSGV